MNDGYGNMSDISSPQFACFSEAVPTTSMRAAKTVAGLARSSW